MIMTFKEAGLSPAFWVLAVLKKTSVVALPALHHNNEEKS